MIDYKKKRIIFSFIAVFALCLSFVFAFVNSNSKVVLAESETEYTIKFVSEGEVVSEEKYHYGDTVVVPEDPTKASDETYNYKFVGWDSNITTVKNNKTYTAIYEKSYINYIIKFEVDGVTVINKKYHYGDTVKVPQETPTKKADNTYTYEFISWYPEVTTVSSDQTYVAKFDATYKEYEIVFINEGVTISDNIYHYNDEVVVPANPTKEATVYKEYTFKGWDKTVSTTCKGSVTYTAVYTESDIYYSVIFMSDGVELQKKELLYGADIVYTKEAPTRENTKEYTYKFIGWDKEFSTVKENVTINAVFTTTKNQYTVKYEVTGLDSKYEDQVLDYGTVIDLSKMDLVIDGYYVTTKVGTANAKDEEYQEATEFTVTDDMIVKIEYKTVKEVEKEEKKEEKPIKEYADDIKTIFEYYSSEENGCFSRTSSSILSLSFLAISLIAVGFISRKRKEN